MKSGLCDLQVLSRRSKVTFFIGENFYLIGICHSYPLHPCILRNVWQSTNHINSTYSKFTWWHVNRRSINRGCFMQSTPTVLNKLRVSCTVFRPTCLWFQVIMLSTEHLHIQVTHSLIFINQNNLFKVIFDVSKCKKRSRGLHAVPFFSR